MANMAKTIFITSFHPLISRNILSTKLIAKLTDKNVRVIVLGPSKKKVFFERELAGSGAVFEGVDAVLDRRDNFLRYLALSAVNTNSLRIKRMTEMKGSGSRLAGVVGNGSFGYKLARFANGLLTPKNTFTALFEKYQPDLVFSADIQNEYDVRLTAEAMSKGIRALGMVRSWDNLGCKGTFRIIPEKILFNNELLRREAVKKHGVPEDKTEVIGIPHYDAYVSGARSPRDEFFKNLGLDPKKKTLLFTPNGDRYLKNNTVDRDVLDIINKNLSAEWQILVRLPPMDKVSYLDETIPNKRVVVDRPQTEYATLKNNEISKEADGHLADSLYWSDLVVSGPSTICIDAALFDKPIILAGFDGYEDRPYKEGVLRFYDYDHWKPVLNSGGVPLAKNVSEFQNLLIKYAENPGLNREARGKMLLEQCQFTDGQSTERLFNLINNLLT